METCARNVVINVKHVKILPATALDVLQDIKVIRENVCKIVLQIHLTKALFVLIVMLHATDVLEAHSNA